MKKIIITLLLVLAPICALGETVVISPFKEVTVTPTIQAAAYATGEIINDGILTLPGVCLSQQYALIQDVVITDAASQGVQIDVVFFNSEIDGYGSVNDAFSPSDADLAAYYQATVSLYTSTSFSSNGAVFAGGQARVVKCDTSGNLYAVLVARGAPTYTSTSDLKLFVRVIQ